MGFSFRPGDDAENLVSPEIENFREKRKLLGEQTTSRRTSSDEVPRPEAPLFKERSCGKATPTRLETRPQLATPSGRLSQVYKVQESDTLSRANSSGSVITAVRHNSGRSSNNGSRNSSKAGGRVRPNHGTGTRSSSSEAVTAAALALAGGKKMPSRPTRMGSSKKEDKIDDTQEDRDDSMSTTASSSFSTGGKRDWKSSESSVFSGKNQRDGI
jgi:hypothetical protein